MYKTNINLQNNYNIKCKPGKIWLVEQVCQITTTVFVGYSIFVAMVMVHTAPIHVIYRGIATFNKDIILKFYLLELQLP